MFSGLMSRWTTPCSAALAKRGRHLPHDRQRVGQVGRAVPGNVLLKVLARHVLLGNVVQLIDAPDLVDLHDVGMDQRRRGLRLQLEPLEIGPIAGQFRPEDLHGHAAFQPGLVGQVDVGHRPATQPAEQLEVAQLPAGEIGLGGRRRKGEGGRGSVGHRSGPSWWRRWCIIPSAAKIDTFLERQKAMSAAENAPRLRSRGEMRRFTPPATAVAGRSLTRTAALRWGRAARPSRRDRSRRRCRPWPRPPRPRRWPATSPRWGKCSDVPHQDRQTSAEGDADGSAHQAQHHGLDEELPQDVVAAGADGHPQADFPRPLGDRHEHDVHDAHAADDQRNAGHGQEQDGHDGRLGAHGVGHFGHVADVEVVELPAADAMPLAQQIGDLVDGLRDLLGGGRLDEDLADVDEPHRLRGVQRGGRGGRRINRRGGRIKVAQRSGGRTRRGCRRSGIGIGRAAAAHAVLDRGPGSEDDVVLVHAHHVGALGGKHADHAQGDVLDAKFLADGRFALKQLPLDRGADHADLAAAEDVAIGEHSAFEHVVPVAHGEVGGRGAVDAHRHPVAVAVDDLAAGADDGGHVGNGRALLGDLVAVLRGEGQHAAGAEAHPAAAGRPGLQHQVVGPHAGDRLLHGDFRALADLGHGNHRAHADDHAQGGQGRAHFVPPQGAQGRAERGRNQRRQRSGRRRFRPRLAVQGVVAGYRRGGRFRSCFRQDGTVRLQGDSRRRSQFRFCQNGTSPCAMPSRRCRRSRPVPIQLPPSTVGRAASDAPPRCRCRRRRDARRPAATRERAPGRAGGRPACGRRRPRSARR